MTPRFIYAPGLLPNEPLAVVSTMGLAEPVAEIVRWLGGGRYVRAAEITDGETPDFITRVVAVDAAAAAISHPDFVMPVPAGAAMSWWDFAAHAVCVGRKQWGIDARNHCRKYFADGVHPLFGNKIEEFIPLFSKHARNIGLVRDALADEESRRAYNAIIGLDFECLLEQCLNRMFHVVEYFEGLRFLPDSRVLSLGIHGGWDVPLLLCCPHESVDLVDPMGADYLTMYAAKFIEAWPRKPNGHRVAVDSYTGTAYLPVAVDGQAIGFANGEKMEHEERSLPCTNFDDFVSINGEFDIIKMDTEGAEERILWGGLASLRKMRPQLAISMYHKPNHYWDLPLWVMRNLPRYRLYIRCYSFTTVETTLYAIPEEVELADGLASPQPLLA